MQYGRPSSDIENPGSWTVTPLWEKIDEEPFDDGDFLVSPKTATGDSFTIGLSSVIDPGVHTGHVVRVRAETGVSGTFKFELLQGAVVIKDSGDIALTTAFAEYNMALSEAEAANITDYTDLQVRVTAIVTQKNQRQNVSWIRVDIPDLAGEEHSGTGSISGNGSTIGTIKKGGLGSVIKSAGGILLAIGLAGMLAIASITGGGSQTGVGEKSVGVSGSISGSGVQAVVGEKDTSNTISISGGGSLTATGSKAEGEEHSGTAFISGNGALVGSVIKQAFSDLPISGGGLLVVIGKAVEYHFGTASVSENGSFVLVGIKKSSSNIIITGNGILVFVASKQVPGDADISVNGAVDGVGKKQTQDDLIITGGGSVIATGEKHEEGVEEHSGIVVVSGNGIIDGAAIKQALIDLTITKDGALNGVGIKQVFGDLIITGRGTIIITGVAVEYRSGIVIISGNGVITGSGIKETDISDLIAVKIIGYLR